jgi:hypothetical protein
MEWVAFVGFLVVFMLYVLKTEIRDMSRAMTTSVNGDEGSMLEKLKSKIKADEAMLATHNEQIMNLQKSINELRNAKGGTSPARAVVALAQTVPTHVDAAITQLPVQINHEITDLSAFVTTDTQLSSTTRQANLLRAKAAHQQLWKTSFVSTLAPGALLSKQPVQNCGSGLGAALTQLGRDHKVVVETGTWNGQHGTLCIIDGLKATSGFMFGIEVLLVNLLLSFSLCSF